LAASSTLPAFSTWSLIGESVVASRPAIAEASSLASPSSDPTAIVSVFGCM
jgi:hypothetical protein